MLIYIDIIDQVELSFYLFIDVYLKLAGIFYTETCIKRRLKFRSVLRLRKLIKKV